jgi:NADPH:quinone reductase-like Zn-dependent oxidoreductase
VLVSVEASSVNGHDVIVRSGELKMVSGRRFPIGVGLDFAGTVAAAGAGVEGYRVGDRVWGMVHPRRRHSVAGAAEYVGVSTERIAHAPADLASVEAAALVVAGSTALIALRDSVRLADGERVLVRGAAGGVGTAAVQLAHAMGGHVTALGPRSPRRAPDRPRRRRGLGLPLHRLGADRAVRRHRRHSRHGTALLPRPVGQGGPDGHRRTVPVGAGRDRRLQRARHPPHPHLRANPETPVLRDVAGHVTSGGLRPVVDSVYPLADIAAAHQAFERGGVVGKHVVTVPRGSL